MSATCPTFGTPGHPRPGDCEDCNRRARLSEAEGLLRDPVSAVLAVECPNFVHELHPCRGCVGGYCGTRRGPMFCASRIRLALSGAPRAGEGESFTPSALPRKDPVMKEGKRCTWTVHDESLVHIWTEMGENMWERRAYKRGAPRCRYVKPPTPRAEASAEAVKESPCGTCLGMERVIRPVDPTLPTDAGQAYAVAPCPTCTPKGR